MELQALSGGRSQSYIVFKYRAAPSIPGMILSDFCRPTLRNCNWERHEAEQKDDAGYYSQRDSGLAQRLVGSRRRMAHSEQEQQDDRPKNPDGRAVEPNSYDSENAKSTEEPFTRHGGNRQYLLVTDIRLHVSATKDRRAWRAGLVEHVVHRARLVAESPLVDWPEQQP